MRSTIEAIASELSEDGLVLRYRNEEGMNADGLTGEEGTFVICSFWLVHCLAHAGELERAEALFDELAGYANDLASWRRRSTPPVANSSGTSRRPSATSG